MKVTRTIQTDIGPHEQTMHSEGDALDVIQVVSSLLASARSEHFVKTLEIKVVL